MSKTRERFLTSYLIKKTTEQSNLYGGTLLAVIMPYFKL